MYNLFRSRSLRTGFTGKCLSGIAGALVLLGAAASADAQITGFGGSTNTGWTLNANTAAATAGVPNVTGTGTVSDVLQLTTSAGGEGTSYWYNTPQSVTNFTESFTYQDQSTGGADGMAVVWQNAGANALGTSGGGLGYSGINTAAALAINIYSGNSGSGTEFNGTIPSTGNPATTPTPGGINLDNGHTVNISLSYKASDLALTETATDTVTNSTYTRVWRNVSIPGQVTGSTAFVGFTGATGGVTAAQSITNFKYTPNAAIATPVAAISPIAGITGWNQNMIVSATAGNHLTASMDAGTSDPTNNAFYEQGLNSANLTTGVPAVGVVFGSATDANHTFMLQPNGAGQNDALMLDVAHPTGTLTFGGTTAYSQLSLLAAGGQGGGNIIALISYANGSTQSVTVNVPDWFSNTPIAWDANGRVTANGSTYGFNSVSNGNPRLYQLDVTPNDTVDAITSINVTTSTTGTGSNRQVIYGVSGTAVAPVPEPTLLGAAAIGAIALVGRRRRSGL